MLVPANEACDVMKCQCSPSLLDSFMQSRGHAPRVLEGGQDADLVERVVQVLSPYVF